MFSFLVRSPFDDIQPTLDLEELNAVLGWSDQRFGNQDGVYRTSSDAGMLFVSMQFLVKASTRESDPSVALDGSSVLFGWVDTRNGNQDMAERFSKDGGGSFAVMRFLVRAPSDDSRPVMSHSSGNAVLAWVDHRSANENISFLSSTNSGASWSPAARLVAAPTDEFEPDCDLLGDLGACVWSDTRDGDPLPHARQSVDGGQTWLTRKKLDD